MGAVGIGIFRFFQEILLLCLIFLHCCELGSDSGVADVRVCARKQSVFVCVRKQSVFVCVRKQSVFYVRAWLCFRRREREKETAIATDTG